MSPEEHANVVSAYLRYLGSLLQPDDRDHQEDWEALATLVTRDPPAAWNVILEVIAKAEPNIRYIIGTGVLESFVYWNAERFVSEIERAIQTDPAFRNTFSSADVDGIPRELFERFRTAMSASGEEYFAEWTWVDTEIYPGG